MTDKRAKISLKTKLAILEEVDKKQISKTKIAEKFKIPKSTLSTIIKNKNKIDNAIASGKQVFNKRLKGARYPELETQLIEWFTEMRLKAIPLNGPTIQQKAKSIAAKLKITECDFSSGWLYRFQKRHGISAHVISGEKNKVNEQTVDEWKQEFRLIRQHYSDKDVFNIDETGVFYNLLHYSDKDVFNIDETGVFYNLLPERTLDFKGKKCYGGTKSKERLTAVLCCNADGSEKLKLWIVGKSKNPRAAILALESNAEKPKWNVLQAMRALAESWNGVSLQIIKNCFRKANVLQAMRALAESWNGVSLQIIKNCFRKAWCDDQQEQGSLDLQELFTSGNLEVVPVIEEPTSSSDDDKELFTSGNLEVVPVIEEPTSSSDDEDEEVNVVTPPSRAELLTALHTIQRFADSEATIDETFTSSLNRLVKECIKKTQPVLRQKTIQDYFK
ncbi:Tc5 transposase DNA-binding domain [Popillia japonica]|uniref:Tc5 transposase DNA-binding domain n=1 Tax=Popillia japonica TaxID=7064 RepID=A0AAW1KPK4_POPJA